MLLADSILEAEQKAYSTCSLKHLSKTFSLFVFSLKSTGNGLEAFQNQNRKRYLLKKILKKILKKVKFASLFLTSSVLHL